MALRDYAGNATPSDLVSGITNVALAFDIPPADAVSWPTGGANGKFFVTIDRGLPAEERLLATSQSGGSFSIAALGDRGLDGTTAVAHSAGASVEHTYSAVDAEEANAHINNAALDQHTQYMLASGTRHDLAARHTFAGLGWTPGAPTTIASDDVAAEGASATPARADHRHGHPAAVPVAIGTTLAEGASASVARADHVHELGSGSIDTAAFFAAGVVDAPALADDAVVSRVIADAAIDTVSYFSSALRPITTSGSAPGSPVADQLWFDSTNNVLNVYDGARWQPIASAGNHIQVHGQGSASFVAESIVSEVVSFGITFAAVPRILTTPRGVGTSGVPAVAVNSDTVTGFTAKVYAGASITGTITFNWAAIGVLA